MSVKKVLVPIFLGLLMVSVFGCNGKNVSPSFTSLTADKIQKVEVFSPRKGVTKSLTETEIVLLIKLLNSIKKDDISAYYGPSVKGGPTTVTIFINSNEIITITLNGDSFLCNEHKSCYQVNTREVNDFINAIYSSSP
ncbi:hypothetical protein H1S01_10720 [Heliobacterium chlorum]|uniref:Lipoprotein n=1 Tax=Heliobacterium chlorum TaxID=2698 RepID=A0ABR7T2W7_HELCL|nr:hypothetical protein [Heliobacterium chlorum]MBC9784981.1 hypothetical protein [Heliobacterium chlorum]